MVDEGKGRKGKGIKEEIMYRKDKGRKGRRMEKGTKDITRGREGTRRKRKGREGRERDGTESVFKREGYWGNSSKIALLPPFVLQ